MSRQADMSGSSLPLNGGRADASSSDHTEGNSNGDNSRKRPRKGPIPGSSSGTGAIACTECRKRKSRCDRENPCGSCIRRGITHLCQPEVRRPPPSVMDIRQTMQVLQSRLQAVEAFLESKLDFQQMDPSNLQEKNDEVKANANTSQIASDDAISSTVPQPTDQEETEIAYFLTGTASLRDFDILPEPSLPLEDAIVHAPSAIQQTARSGTGTIIQPVRHPSTAWQRQLFTSILPTIPSASQARRFTLLYFRHQEWQIHAVSRSQMLQEIDELETIQNEGRMDETDPAWLALLFQVMSFGLVTSYTIDEQDYPEDVYETVKTQVQLSQRCLAAADWAEVPSIRVLQTLIVHGWWAQHIDADANLFEASAAAGQSSRMRAAVALSHCQSLGLDKLGDKESIMPRPDPALPRQASGFRRQMGLKIWHSFQFLESLSGHVYTLPGTFSSAAPALCQDTDLGESLTVPQMNLAENPDSVNVQLCLSTVKARRSYLIAKEKGTIPFEEADKLEASCIPDLAEIISAIMRMSEDMVPPCFGTREGYAHVLRMIRGAGILRIRRLAIRNVTDPFSPSARVYLGRVQEAAAALVCLLTSATNHGRQIIRKFPMCPLYLLNAGVTLTVALCKETSESQSSLTTGLIKDAICTLTSEGLRSRSSAIKANSEKALLTLDKLIHFLLLHRSTNTDEEGKESLSHKSLSQLSAKILHASNDMVNIGKTPQASQAEDATFKSANEPHVFNDGHGAAHGDLGSLPSIYEVSETWNWPFQGYGEAEVGEPMTDFSSWSLLQYLEGDYASP